MSLPSPGSGWCFLEIVVLASGDNLQQGNQVNWWKGHSTRFRRTCGHQTLDAEAKPSAHLEHYPILSSSPTVPFSLWRLRRILCSSSRDPPCLCFPLQSKKKIVKVSPWNDKKYHPGRNGVVLIVFRMSLPFVKTPLRFLSSHSIIFFVNSSLTPPEKAKL